MDAPAPGRTTAPDRPLPLTRDRIAEAALVFIDRNGLDGLSMRKLGAELGVEAMSLYNHVERKADLLEAVTDRLYREVLDAHGDPEGDWRTHARALAQAYFRVAAAHPNAVPLLIGGASVSPAGDAFDTKIEEAAMLLTDDPHVGALAFATVADWVIGAIVTHHGLVQAARAEPGPRPGVDDPGVVHAEIETITAEERFTEGLETVLAGVAARYGVL